MSARKNHHTIDTPDFSPEEPGVGWSSVELKQLRARTAQDRATKLLGQVREIAQEFIGARSRDDIDDDEDSASSLRKMLFVLNPAIRVVRIETGLAVLKAPPHVRVPKLPWPYGIKGGGARLALERLLQRERSADVPRDLDLVRFGSSKGGSALTKRDEQMARRFMAEDWQHGHGVEVAPSIEAFLQTRDLTVNEVVLLSGQIICSVRCIQDCLRGTIQPTAHLTKKGVTGATALKGARLVATRRVAGRPGELCGFDEAFPSQPFDLRLNYLRALEHSPQVAEMFLSVCISRNLLPPEYRKYCSCAELAKTILVQSSEKVC